MFSGQPSVRAGGAAELALGVADATGTLTTGGVELAALVVAAGGLVELFSLQLARVETGATSTKPSATSWVRAITRRL
jgi:hypothetical protein